MKYFKTEGKQTADKHLICDAEFEAITGRKMPFEQINQRGAMSQYALCPSCLNPIQLVGLFKETKIDPYGKHTGKDIEGMPEWRYNKYVYCPYADRSHRIPPSDEFDHLLITQEAVDLYEMLKSEFDLAVILISSTFHIRANEKFWTKCLHQYVASAHYTYPWLTDANLPYIFAYFGMQHQNLLGIKVKEETKLYDALATHPDVMFVNHDGNGYSQLSRNKNYLHLIFRFCFHRQNAIEGKELTESMMLYIDDTVSGQEVYREKIVFSETDFSRMKRYTKNRQQWLLDIAERCMPTIQPNA